MVRWGSVRKVPIPRSSSPQASATGLWDSTSLEQNFPRMLSYAGEKHKTKKEPKVFSNPTFLQNAAQVLKGASTPPTPASPQTHFPAVQPWACCSTSLSLRSLLNRNTRGPHWEKKGKAEAEMSAGLSTGLRPGTQQALGRCRLLSSEFKPLP